MTDILNQTLNLDNLGGILDAVLPLERPTVTVDITPFLNIDNPDRRVVLTWVRPNIAQLYNRLATIQDLVKRFPTWSIHQAVEVATLAACHQGPPTGKITVGEFYARIADGDNDRLWQFLEAERIANFPHLSDVDPVTLKKILLAQILTEQPTPSQDSVSDTSTSGPQN